MGTRLSVFHWESGLAVEFFVSDCAQCGVVFAITTELEDRRRQDRARFYCPNGHTLVFSGKTDEQKLKEATARETALRDQLDASIRDAEAGRQALLRDRQRFANGVCPCCNRSFQNVRRHMSTQHPEYTADVTKPLSFECGCGESFGTFHGLRTHQGHKRSGDWAKPGQPSWRAHLTAGVTL